MPSGQLFALVAFALLLAAGQILFKRAAIGVPSIATAGGLTGLLLAPSFWLALLLYGSATLLWLRILHVVPLSRAYPFAALGFVLVPAAGLLLFGEKLSRNYLVGMLLILGGIATVSIS